jgi:3-mercaptopyruvate sulfurtransferase SseA
MQRKCILFVILILVSACSAQATQTQPTLAPTQIVEPAFTAENLPQSEADVPRISVEEAKAAFENNEAIIVDVRRSDYFESSHIAGAISVPLSDIEQNSTSVPLNKEQWIITYCT